MAYDVQRGATVLFGGTDAAGNLYDDTWEWNGKIWAFRGVTGPEARTEHAMVYDAQQDVTILMGGETTTIPGSSTSGRRQVDTWAWDGEHWTQRVNYPLPYFSGAAAAYDQARRETIASGISGLYGEVSRGETWTWNGNIWTMKATGAPAFRRDHSMAYDEARSVAVMFGGYDPTPSQWLPLYDTWEWNGMSWNSPSPTATPPCNVSPLAYDAARGVTVLYCGWFDENESRYRGDLWEWNGDSWSFRAAEGPGFRSGHALTYDKTRQVFVLFGGASSDYETDCGLLGDTWEWDGNLWTLRSESGPNPRQDAVMTFDSDRNVTVLFGGYWVDPACECCDYAFDTWEWDGVEWTEQTTAGTASPLEGPIVYDTFRQTVVLPRGSSLSGNAYEYSCECATVPSPPLEEVYSPCSGQCYATKNRYLSFAYPASPCDLQSIAFRVTLGPMPNANDCPKLSDYSAFDDAQMWVGPEVLAYGATSTSVHKLQATPLFQSWTNMPSVIQLSDCNIVPCATYTIEAIREVDYPEGPYSPPLILTTTPTWGDIVGANNSELPNGIVDFNDISACVDRFKNYPGAPPRTWCDVADNNPTQGVNMNIDFDDISVVVDAFKGRDYPFPGPTAPAPCP